MPVHAGALHMTQIVLRNLGFVRVRRFAPARIDARHKQFIRCGTTARRTNRSFPTECGDRPPPPFLDIRILRRESHLLSLQRRTVTSKDSLNGLTGLRALAALWVIAFHYRIGPFRPLGANHVAPFFGYGYLAVDMFFILSGFVIWHAHAADFIRPTLRSFVRFLSLRGARLYPVHLFTLALLALLLWLAPQIGDPPLNPANYTGRQLLLQLALVQSWGFSHQLSWNYPSWSISAEWFCYLVFPFAALGIARLPRSATVAAGCGLFAIIGLSYATIFDQSMNQAIGALTLLRCLPEFLLGCLLRQFAGQTDIATWPWLAIVLGTAALWSAAFWSSLPVGPFAIPCFTALILACSVPSSIVARIMSWRPLTAIGAASYSLYLMQAPVQKGARVLKAYLSPSHPLRSSLVVLVFLGLLAIGAMLVHLLVENPSRRQSRRLIDRYLPKHRHRHLVSPRRELAGD